MVKKSALDILKYYYGNDISIKYDAPVGNVEEGYPGSPVGLGYAGNPVLAIQRDLRRIKKNYPAIPDINNTIGLYDSETEKAVCDVHPKEDINSRSSITTRNNYA